MAAEWRYGSLPPRRRSRAATAFVLAPIAVSFLLTLLMTGIAMLSGGQVEFPSLLPVWAGIALIGIGLMLALGWPFHALAFRRRWRTAPTYIGAGGIAGLVVAMIISLTYSVAAIPLSAASALGVMLASSLFVVIPSLLAAWVFWLIRRPDRDQDGDPAQVFE